MQQRLRNVNTLAATNCHTAAKNNSVSAASRGRLNVCVLNRPNRFRSFARPNHNHAAGLLFRIRYGDNHPASTVTVVEVTCVICASVKSDQIVLPDLCCCELCRHILQRNRSFAAPILQRQRHSQIIRELYRYTSPDRPPDPPRSMLTARTIALKRRSSRWHIHR